VHTRALGPFQKGAAGEEHLGGEHKRTEEAMFESEKFHRLAVEAGRIGTWDLNLQTDECLISPEMAELMGFSSDQTTVLGAQWRKSIVPDDRTLMSSALAPAIASGALFDLEFRIALKDGTQRWLYSRGAVSRDASGKAVRMYGASIDVTERKQADEKLRESEERLRRAIEIETVGVIFFKTDGSITNANDAFLRMSGYSREDLAEGLVRWDEMTPPEWMPHSLKAIEEFESTGRTIPYEKQFVRKDGSRWWALFAATRLDEEEGVEFIIDITQSKRAEDELRKSGERITNILESITDAFVAVDRQWRFTYINERALTTLQRTREELLGKNMWEEFPEAVGLPAYREYHRAMTSGNSVHFEEFNPWLDIWVEINAYPSEGGLAIYFRDITERKRAEEERDRLRAREIEARTQKEERRRIARDLHDVVLQDLVGVLQSLRLSALHNKDSGLGLDLEEELDALRRATLGLRSAVNDLRGEKERPFVKSVESLVELNRRLAPDCNIELLVEEGFPNGLLGDAGLELLRVIREAFTNARYHSGAKRVVVTLKVEGSDLVAEISDDGQGFELEATPGVGLSSMQERAAMVDGKLEIESEVGRGTSVRLRVPVPQAG
jgi:PAS domain S-box-containing protein